MICDDLGRVRYDPVRPRYSIVLVGSRTFTFGRLCGSIRVPNATNETTRYITRCPADIPITTIMPQPNQRICRCSECSLHTITSGTGEIKGRIIPSRTYGLHQKRRYATDERIFFARLTLQSSPIGNTAQGPKAIDAGPHTVPEDGLRTLAAELKRRSRQFILTTGLVFTIPPTVDAPMPELPTMDPNDLRLHKLSLTPNELVNAPISEYEKWLLMAKNKVFWNTGDTVPSDHLLADLEKEFRSLQRHKLDEWRRLQERICLQKRLETFSGSLVQPAVCASVVTGTCSGPWLRVGTYTSLSRIFWWGSAFHRTADLDVLCPYGDITFDLWPFSGRLYIFPSVHRADTSDEFRARRSRRILAQTSTRPTDGSGDSQAQTRRTGIRLLS